MEDEGSSSCVSSSSQSKLEWTQKNYSSLIYLVQQFLYDENLKETLHLLEEESKIVFHVDYLGDSEWDKGWRIAEEYLKFVGADDEAHSRLSALKSQMEKEGEETKSGCATERDKLQDNVMPRSVRQSALVHLLNLIYPNSNKDTRIFKEQLVYLIIQFLYEQNFYETVHKLEQESKIFFNMDYFQQFVTDGEWSKAEEYLSAFTEDGDAECSANMLYEMRKHEYLEAKDRNDWLQMGSVLQRDLLAFSGRNSKILNELVEVMSCDNIRETKLQFEHLNVSSGRANLLASLKQLIAKSPLQDKCNFPLMDKGRLLTLVMMALNWWVPYRFNCFLENQSFTFENIPKVPHLFHCPSPIKNKSSSEAGNIQVPDGNGAGAETYFIDVHSVSSVNAVSWKLKEINEPSECRTLILPDSPLAERWVHIDCTNSLQLGNRDLLSYVKPLNIRIDVILANWSGLVQVARLMYSYKGDLLLALTEDAKNKLWTWQNSCEKASTVNVQPKLYEPSSGMMMINEMGTSHQTHCFALFKSHLFSASGGKISIFCLKTFEELNSFGGPPCTYFTFCNEHSLALGFNNSSIVIRCLNTKTQAKLEGHGKRITCLAFSNKLNVLVSAGGDAQLCVWDADNWQKRESKFLYSLCSGQVPDPAVINMIQFHQDQVHLLAVCETQIDIYEAPLLKHVLQWVPTEAERPITSATYSSDGQSIYVSFKTGCIKVLVSTTLRVRCQINKTAYSQPCTSLQAYPLVIAAHPTNPNQIALGLSNGRVHVLQPLESQEWGQPPPSQDQHVSAG
ncbi:hypothetical protein CCACVL1_06763 [Corchorus capsularis]|uniref:CTLH domain-containing protein n=1 Tax=Corchorus capsularis TaxID=210143 RepID=A0A1R3JD33_COCAP|nr:hypothetical protein CCACVL1_06763 [Corchorus capsularis]